MHRLVHIDHSWLVNHLPLLIARPIQQIFEQCIGVADGLPKCFHKTLHTRIIHHHLVGSQHLQRFADAAKRPQQIVADNAKHLVLGLVAFGEQPIGLIELFERLFQPEMRCNARKQLLAVKRLGDIISPSHFKTFYNTLRLCFGGKKYYRYFFRHRVLLQPLAHFVAVHVGHHHVEKDQIERDFLCFFQRLFSTLRKRNVVVVAAQNLSCNSDVDRVVVDK